MKTRAPFDLLETPIGAGTFLIEASAGTGKTYTVSALVLRLLLERPELTVDRILVTTYTELATAELRGRIRELLRKAIGAFHAGQSDDKVLVGLLRAHKHDSTAVRRLEEALLNFDEAPIYTIHGFCQRVLTERAFESGTLFDAELVTNQSDLLREIVQDFWRLHFYGDRKSLGKRFALLLTLKNKVTPDALAELLGELVENPTLRVLPEKTRPLSEIVRELDATVTGLRDAWAAEAETLRELFQNPDWAKNKSAKPAVTLPLLDDLHDCLGEEGGTVEQLACFEAFAASTIRRNLRVGFDEPQSPVFAACEKLLQLESEFCVALKVAFFAYARAELRERKLFQNVLSFDDLLTRLAAALSGPDGARLAESIREKYQAALIDEFQDTDPVQYAIFARIYAGSDAPVAFIGDPKQAIYAFRGADVFTYLRAAADARRQFTLTTNWRSESRLIDAVNTIFDRDRPFLLEEIKFDRAQPGPKADDNPLLIAGEKKRPFQLWLGEKEDDPAETVASEIVQLLASAATIGNEPIEPRHLAVLTSTNAQAARIQSALRMRRVPSVLYSSADVFKTHEAAELRDVLAAVAQPGYEKFVRAALTTDALGRNGNDLDTFSRDERAWETELLRFQKHHQTWRERGFIQMLRQLASDHAVRRRLLAFPDGERRLTNVLHLTELLHGACVEHGLGMNGLLKWLGQQMSTSFAERAEHELRLESDEKAVRLITVHKSKGLEFDVVFAPFVWHVGKIRGTYHDTEAEHRLTLDLGNPKGHEEQREEQGRAELLRQFYVALTRARHRSSMVWQAPKRGQDKSAPAYLLKDPTKLPPEIESSSEIEAGPLPPPTSMCWEPGRVKDTGSLAPLSFKAQIDCSWGIASFTRLTSARDDDELDEGPLIEPPSEKDLPAAEGMHAFPRGTRAGTCLHEILEKVDFADLAKMPELVSQRLRAYNFKEADAMVTANVRHLSALPLRAAQKPFTLADVPNDARIPELEFWYPVDQLTSAKLAQAFALEEMPVKIDRLQFDPINGFMNGFIDLTFEREGRFYFADWKSNWLGLTNRAYHHEAIETEMRRNFYALQLCLYSVALHRYLLLRKPDYDFEKHFGGAFYIFLRGIDPAQPGQSVYFRRPNRKFVETLSELIGS